MISEEKKYLDRIIGKYHHPISSKIRIMQDLQARFGYLKDSHMRYVADRIGTSFMDLYSIATFYSQFNLNPPGKHTILICEGTACHVKNAKQVLSKLTEVLGIDLDETTEDGLFSLKSVRCLGCCGLAPVIMIDDETFGRVDPSKVKEIISLFE